MRLTKSIEIIHVEIVHRKRYVKQTSQSYLCGNMPYSKIEKMICKVKMLRQCLFVIYLLVIHYCIFCLSLWNHRVCTHNWLLHGLKFFSYQFFTQRWIQLQTLLIRVSLYTLEYTISRIKATYLVSKRSTLFH